MMNARASYRIICLSVVLGVLLPAMVASAQRSLTLTAPVGGDKWFGPDENITWTLGGTGWNGTELLHIEYSRDSGVNWITETETASAAAQTYFWYVNHLEGAPFYRVRITCLEDPAVTDATTDDFRLGSINFYVNDNDLTDDVYCTAVGNNNNDGLDPGRPKATVQNLLDTYDLEQGDTVWIDTGYYLLTANITVGVADGGVSDNPVKFVGSPNGTLLDRNAASTSSSRVFEVTGAYVQLGDVGVPLRITHAYYGISLASSPGSAIINCEIYGCGNRGIDVGSSLNTTVSDCLVRDNSGRGIYLADAISTSTSIIRRNTVRNNLGDGIYAIKTGGGVMQLHHNLVVNNEGRGIHIRCASGNSRFNAYNNTVYGSGLQGVYLSTDTGGTCNFRNNIIHTSGHGTPCVYVDGIISGTYDYNTYYAAGGAHIGFYAVNWSTIGGWRSATGQDMNSIITDPLFVNPLIGDFHLMSTAGSWHGGSWHMDATTSRAIDAGDPADSTGLEPLPHGGRTNQGAYGATAEASKTPVERLLTLLSPMGGETWATGSQVIRWNLIGQEWSGIETVTIEYSDNKGVTWTPLTMDTPASAGTYTWDITELTGRPTYMVRIICNEHLNVTDTCSLFRIGTHLGFYVNDASTFNDIFCTAAGTPTGDGLSPATPSTDIQHILDTYQLNAGDTVFVDSGTYNLTSNIVITAANNGVEDNWVTLQGSPNFSILNRQSSSVGTKCIEVHANYIRVQGFVCRNAHTGISVNIDTAKNADINNNICSDNAAYGVEITTYSYGSGANYTLKNNLLYNNGNGMLLRGNYHVTNSSATFLVENNTIISTGYGLDCKSSNNSGGKISIQNNIVWAHGSGSYCIFDVWGSVAFSDYNNFLYKDGARMASRIESGYTRYYDAISDWIVRTGHDIHSMTKNPFFVNPNNGDYHLQSTSGSWHGGDWLTDPKSSPCIDAGNPTSTYANETLPNGGRINMGAYGNTPQASRTPNERIVTLLAPVGGEHWPSGDQTIRWHRMGLAWSGTETLRIDYSADAGRSWTLLKTVAASLETYVWNVDGLWPSPLYRLRIRCVQDVSASDESGNFRIGSAAAYYINDNSQIDDLYCTAIGNDSNNGQTPGTPKRTIEAIFSDYILAPGDTIYIDTGTYALTSDLIISANGNAQFPISIVGSTNPTGATLIRNAGHPSCGIHLAGSHIRLQGLRVCSGHEGIRSSGTENEIDSCQIFGNAIGLIVEGPGLRITNSVIRDNTETGILTSNVPVSIINNTLAGNKCGVAQTGFSGVFKNNIVAASGAGSHAIDYSEGFFESGALWDYNNLYTVSGASVAIVDSGATHWTFSDWRSATGMDGNSISADPLFVDAANNNYHLRTTSPCVDAGSNHDAPLFDMDGNSRPFGQYVDIGADEANKPSQPGFELSPITPTTVNNLVCTVTIPTVVSPELTPQYEYVWSNGFDTVIHGPTLSPTDTLSAAFTRKDQTWLCTVRGYDGYGYSDPAAASVLVRNTPPGTFLLSFPETVGPADNLMCVVSGRDPDPDGDVSLSFLWKRIRGGVEETAPSFEAPDYAWSQINNSETEAGDAFYCLVTLEEDGIVVETKKTEPHCLILAHGTAPSFISMDTNSQSITLGDTSTAFGYVFPTPESGASVFFKSLSPSGVVSESFPEGLIISGSAYTRHFYFPEASEDRTPWRLGAWWPGNSTYMPAESDEVDITVNKAQPSLLLSLSHTSALVNLAGVEGFEIAAALTVAGFPPELQSLLAGRTMRLSIQAPDGQTPWTPLEAATDASGTARFTKAMFDAAGVSFGASGVWRFRADFAGNENLRAAATADFSNTTARLTIKEGAGYAILVLGRLDAQAEGHAEHGQTTDYIYSILRGRNFVDEDIYYLRAHLPGEIDRGWPVDGPATAENLQYAIETWARDKMLASPAPLYLILVDHGSPGIFHMDIGHTGPNEYVTAQEIDGWLSVLQSALGQTKENVDAVSRRAKSGQRPLLLSTDMSDESDQPIIKSSPADLDIVVVYGACYSGSFIPVLSGPNRTLITASDAQEISYRGVLNAETGLRDGDFFLTEFFRNAGEGRTLKDAFELACQKTAEYTATRTGANATAPQHPQLDDNGDGAGTTGGLSTAPGLDGARAAGMDLGLGSNAGNSVGWFTARPPATLAPGGTLEGGLWAESTGRELAPGDTAWVEIKTPSYADGAVATEGYEDFQRVAALVGPIPYASAQSLGGGRTRFSWSEADLTTHLAGGFATPGTYKAYYFLRDGNTGQVGAYLVTNVYVSQTGNEPPAPVTLLYPAYDGIVNVSLFLAWTRSVDPNADPVTYRVEICQDPAFPAEGTLVRDGLTDTALALGVGDGILNDHDYYWRVIPTDPYGATPDENAVGRFLVRGSPGVPGAIMGQVRVSKSVLGVPGATLTLIPTAAQGASNASGAYFLGNVSQGVYNMTIAAPGYLSHTETGVIVVSGQYTLLDVELEPDGTNHAPVLTPIGNKRVVAGRTLAFLASATDIDPGQTLSFSATGLPEGATFDAAMREFRWTPHEGQARTEPYLVTFIVTDNGAPPLSASETVAITVDRGAHIHGPRYAVLGDRVVLEFCGVEYIGPWHTQWEHNDVVLPDEHNEELIIESATFEHAGWYRATQVLNGKTEPATAEFYLIVYEAMPLRGWALLAALVATATLVVMMAGRGKTSRGRVQASRPHG